MPVGSPEQPGTGVRGCCFKVLRSLRLCAIDGLEEICSGTPLKLLRVILGQTLISLGGNGIRDSKEPRPFRARFGDAVDDQIVFLGQHLLKPRLADITPAALDAVRRSHR